MARLFVKGTAFVLHKNGFLAYGLALKNGTFILCKGSCFKEEVTHGFAKYRAWALRVREELEDEGMVIHQPGVPHKVFTDDYKFKNISTCTSVILGQSRSGDYWTNAEGLTYPEWSRKTVRKPKPKSFEE